MSPVLDLVQKQGLTPALCMSDPNLLIGLIPLVVTPAFSDEQSESVAIPT